MKKALIVASTSGFIKGFLMHDAKLLQEMGYEVHCAANASKMVLFKAEDYFGERNVVFHQVDFSSTSPVSKETVNAYKQIKKLLKENEFDFIHCHTPIVGAIVRYAAKPYRKKGTKIVYTTHGLAFPEGCKTKDKLIFGSIENVCSRWSDAIITINKADFKMMQKMHCNNVYYINGVGADLSKFEQVNIDRSEYRKSLGVSDDETMILSVGELSYRKNHQVIINALAQLKNNKIIYVICGKAMSGAGTYDHLVKLAEKNNVRVKFLGFREDIPEINHCADIAALPSTREGLGMAGIEALSAGVPVVGSAVQGIMDYVIPNKTGYLANAFDVEQFAKNINKLLDIDTRKSMRNYCKNKAKEFSTDVSWKQMSDIYYCILDGEN